VKEGGAMNENVSGERERQILIKALEVMEEQIEMIKAEYRQKLEEAKQEVRNLRREADEWREQYAQAIKEI
jgi:F0F1-type ATP synthase membrane subunit b/b'